jgi:S-formylglutathione hydrolase FrmB
VRWFDHVSLLTGPLPVLLGVLAFTMLGVVVVTRRLVALSLTLLLAAGSLGLVVLVGLVTGIEHRVGSTFPHSFFVWAALPVFAAALAGSRWGSMGWPRRAVAVAAIVLLVGFGLDQIDAHYAYLPTVGDVLGRPVEDQVVFGGGLVHGQTHESPSDAHGTVVAVDLPGTVSGFHARRAMVWLPPIWSADHPSDLPALIVLGGVPGDPANMIRAGGAVTAADAYAQAHGGRAPILVFADQNGSFLNDTECVDGPRGNSEQYLIDDVRHGVEQRFGASTDGRRWGIVGYSEGGTCAITVALRHPGDFAGFLDIAGDLEPSAATGPHARSLTVRRLYRGDAEAWWQHDPFTLLRHRATHGLMALFAAGFKDRNGAHHSEVLATAARRAGLATRYDLFSGGHDFGLVTRAIDALMPTLADRVLEAPSPPSSSAAI